MAEGEQMEIRCMCGEWHAADPSVTLDGAVIVACPTAPPGMFYGGWTPEWRLVSHG